MYSIIAGCQVSCAAQLDRKLRPRLLKGHLERVHPAREQVLRPGQLGQILRRRRTQARQAPQQSPKGDLSLQAGQRRAQTVVNPAPEGQVPIVFLWPRDIEPLRVEKPLRVRVCGEQRDEEEEQRIGPAHRVLVGEAARGEQVKLKARSEEYGVQRITPEQARAVELTVLQDVLGLG